MKNGPRIVIVLLALVLAACAPRIEPSGPPVVTATLNAETARMLDGAELPLRKWLPEGPPRAVILALHGFNMYSEFFETPAKYWAAHGIATYAYDQRGFGAAPHPGIWAGQETMVGDALTMAALVAERHPGVPLYLLGDSMGGAIVLLAITGIAPPKAAGAIMVAPALWARRTMNPIQRGALWFASHTVPALKLTGQGLDITPSDNVPMLEALGRDPLVIKETRVDALKGITDLMDAAYDAAARIRSPSLLLYGLKDEIIPEKPTFQALSAIPPDAPVRIAFYPGGYHMLLRDLDAEPVWNDILHWIGDPAAPLPSHADDVAEKALGRAEGTSSK